MKQKHEITLLKHLSRKKIHKISRVMCIFFAMVFVVTLITGCAGVPTWLTDAQSLMPIITASISSLLGIVTLLTGKTLTPEESSILNQTIQGITNSISDVEKAIQEYNANPGTGTVANIEAAAQVVINNLESFLKDLNITDPATQQKFITIATTVLQEFQAWASLIPTLSAQAGTKMTLTVPLGKKEFHQKIVELLKAPTGNNVVDEACASIHV